MAATRLAPAVLADLREDAAGLIGRFVDPVMATSAKRALARRGETWAASVLARDLVRRSILFPGLPWLEDGEAELLTLADSAETRLEHSAGLVVDRAH